MRLSLKNIFINTISVFCINQKQPERIGFILISSIGLRKQGQAKKMGTAVPFIVISRFQISCKSFWRERETGILSGCFFVMPFAHIKNYIEYKTDAQKNKHSTNQFIHFLSPLLSFQALSKTFVELFRAPRQRKIPKQRQTRLLAIRNR